MLLTSIGTGCCLGNAFQSHHGNFAHACIHKLNTGIGAPMDWNISYIAISHNIKKNRVTLLKIPRLLSGLCCVWIGPSWPASQETDGASLFAVTISLCACLCVCACMWGDLPGQYPRSEIYVWCLVGKSRGSMLSTIWHFLPKMELEKTPQKTNKQGN